MKLPLISIITINFNSLDDTLELLSSLHQCSYPNVEIIVVDNHSDVDPTNTIKQKFPDVNLIMSDRNLGFAGGNNLGVKASKGKYFFFLNNDAVVTKNFFEPIVSFLEQNEGVGMISPKVLYPDGKTIQYAGAIGINPFTGRGKRLGLGEQDHGQYDAIQKTDLGHGGAMIVPRKVIEKVGMMPEMYFLYYEEHDWAEIMKREGFDIFYFGKASILHKESATIGAVSPVKTYYMSRNRILFLKRNSKGLQYLMALGFIIFLSIPINTLRMMLKRQFKLIKVYYQGVFWHLNPPA